MDASALSDRERSRLHELHRHERAAMSLGHRLVAGIDEVGRGPLAGPVVAACIVVSSPLYLPGLNDSKKVPEARRSVLATAIAEQASGWGVGLASVAEIERLNILGATLLAMERALAAVECPIDYLITDAVRLPHFTGPQEPLIHGDARSAVVAAASIVAKVHRDALMRALDREDPRYGYAAHKGYGTPAHLTALGRYGPSPHHRRAFAPVRAAQLALDLHGTPS
ncbi:MAG: ribonuclease HII [Bacillati bacterium]